LKGEMASATRRQFRCTKPRANKELAEEVRLLWRRLHERVDGKLDAVHVSASRPS